MPTSRPGARRLPFRVLGAFMATALLAVLAFAGWSLIGRMEAEPEPWRAVLEEPRVTIQETEDSLVLRPSEADTPRKGMVFFPGAKVAPEAYAARLAPLVREWDLAVVIVEPPLRLALADRRGLDEFTAAVPEVGSWLVGGHSMGGVRACALADQADGLVLFASYCATDLSEEDLPVLSISGSEDGLSTPEKIAEHRDALPEHAEMIEIAGASHASFGDYGSQSGDGTAALEDEEMDAAVQEAFARFLEA